MNKGVSNSNRRNLLVEKNEIVNRRKVEQKMKYQIVMEEIYLQKKK